MKVTFGQITDKGLNPKRTNNEDNLLALPERGLFLVADGVGGRLGGEVASRTVIEVFERVFKQQHEEDLREVIAWTIELCNQKIFEDAHANPDLDGMATTLALIAVEGARAIIAHVGDSRVYRFDEQGLISLTEDHSEVNEQLRAGTITAEQAARHPRRNVISRAIGADHEVEADFREIEIDEFSSFVLCTDGITLHLTDSELSRLMKSGQHPQSICNRMKELCYRGGAEDNLTAIIVNFGERRYTDEELKNQAPSASVESESGAPDPGTPTPAGTASTAQPSPVAKFEISLKPESRPEPDRKQTAQLKLNDPQQPVGVRAEQPTQKTFSLPRPARRSITISIPEIPTPNLLKEGEWSKVMKMSLLVAALLVGAVLGYLLHNVFGRFFGKPEAAQDINQSRNIKNQPSDPEINAAYAQYLEGKTEEARTRLNKAVADNPNNAEAHYYLGLMDYAQSKFEDSINHLSVASKIDPQLADVRIHLAMAYLAVGQPRNAKDLLQQLVIAPPRSKTPTPSATPRRAAGPAPVG